jgi:hypothetical protein
MFSPLVVDSIDPKCRFGPHKHPERLRKFLGLAMWTRFSLLGLDDVFCRSHIKPLLIYNVSAKERCDRFVKCLRSRQIGASPGVDNLIRGETPHTIT